jgi:diaminobutyrate-2-oxoglutarate transaminase
LAEHSSAPPTTVRDLPAALALTDAPARLDEPAVRGALPGPESARLLARQDARESNARSYPRKLPIAIQRGEGSYVEDMDGNGFIDS